MSSADEDVVIALSRPEELFSVDQSALLHGETRTVPGVVELVDELLGRSRVGRRAQIVVTLPATEIQPGTAAQLQAAIERYCRGRIATAQRDTQVLWRQGLRSLRSGSILFIVGLLLSAGFLEPDIDIFWQNLLGNGVFLVIAWVGLWYPLDLLFFARQPLRREIQILEVLRRSPVELRPGAGPEISPADVRP